jgi:hypothetical protein
MGIQVQFSYTTWAAGFPQFSTIKPDQINNIVLPIAQIYHRNDGGGPVTTAATQTALLNLMVAHIAQILFGVNGNAPSAIVGRISSATEGSVAVASEFPVTKSSAFFLQTPFGGPCSIGCLSPTFSPVAIEIREPSNGSPVADAGR